MLTVKQMDKLRKYRMNKAEHISYNWRWRPKQTVVDINMTVQMRPHRLAVIIVWWTSMNLSYLQSQNNL